MGQIKFETLLIGFAAVQLWGLAPVAGAEPYLIKASDLPPYTKLGEDMRVEGFVIEVIKDSLKAKDLEFALPANLSWKRAQVEAIATPMSLIGPLARTSQREEQYRWLAVILEEKLVIYRPKGAAGPVNAADLAKLRHIGVNLGSAAENTLEALGLRPVIETAPNALVNATKLASGHLDAWCAQWLESLGPAGTAAIAGRIEFAFDLVDQPLWLATSRATPPKEADAAMTALLSYRDTKSYEERLKQLKREAQHVP